jgi:hypothetical protein
MASRCLLSTTAGRLYPYREDPTLLAHRRRLLHRAEGRVLDLSERWEADLACFRPAQVDSLTVAVRVGGRRRDRWLPGVPALPWPVARRSGPRQTASGLNPTVVAASAGLDALMGSDPGPAEAATARDPLTATLPEDAQPVPDGPGFLPVFDTVVASLTLCTVDSLDRTLDAIGSWLAPDGQILVVGHVLGTGVTGLVQSAFSPAGGSAVARAGGLGCHLDQDLPTALRAAGLQLTDCARFTTRIGALVPLPCLAGVARRRSA